jgi:secreted trypsin-like serine protease
MSAWRRLGALTICALALLALPAAAQAGGGAQASIVGGKASTIEEFPSLTYIEAFQPSGTGFSCTGTVIAPRVVLTAAHCVEDLEGKGGFTPVSDYAVATGVAKLGQARHDNVFPVVDSHVFPRFDPGALYGDAALLVLARPTSAPPLPIAGAEDAALYAGGAPVRLAGWGRLRAGTENTAGQLRSASLVVKTPQFCASHTKFARHYYAAAQLCTLDVPDRHSGGCFGDSGGPAIAARADGTPVELGIISSGGPGCNPLLPNVLTRADLVSAWAQAWVAAVETGAPPPQEEVRAPRMGREAAEEFTVFTLLHYFEQRFKNAAAIDGRCDRGTATSFRCHLTWVFGSTFFYGTVTPFYSVKRGTTTWESHFRINWTPLHCLSDAAHHCPLRGKRG